MSSNVSPVVSLSLSQNVFKQSQQSQCTSSTFCLNATNNLNHHKLLFLNRNPIQYGVRHCDCCLRVPPHRTLHAIEGYTIHNGGQDEFIMSIVHCLCVTVLGISLARDTYHITEIQQRANGRRSIEYRRRTAPTNYKPSLVYCQEIHKLAERRSFARPCDESAFLLNASLVLCDTCRITTSSLRRKFVATV